MYDHYIDCCALCFSIMDTFISLFASIITSNYIKIVIVYLGCVEISHDFLVHGTFEDCEYQLRTKDSMVFHRL